MAGKIPGTRRELDEGTEIQYKVFCAAFTNGEAELVGSTSAIARMHTFANYSAVRWMVVGETRDGFAMRGFGVADFLLPAVSWLPVREPAPDSEVVPTSDGSGGVR